MKSQRDNLLDLYNRKGYSYVPVEFELCPHLETVFKRNANSNLPYEEYFDMPGRGLAGLKPVPADPRRFDRYHPVIDNRTTIDWIGVGHRSSPTSMHMTQMLHPLENADSAEQIDEYPLPVFTEEANAGRLKAEAEAIQAKGYAAVGYMACTVWENSWYLRGMENLMADMMSGDDMAVRLLDKVTDMAVSMACLFAMAGADIISLGDDIGMQSTIMMSESLYLEWIQPRLKRVISEIKRIRPETVVFYHSCGFVTPMIPHLIEAGIDVLDPVQPECMDFKDIFGQFGGQLSFHGTIGTQSTMPFGAPAEVRRAVERNLTIAGNKGGLFPTPLPSLRRYWLGNRQSCCTRK